jgi:hypothetical protein
VDHNLGYRVSLLFKMILTHGNTVASVEAGHLLCFGIGVLLLGIGALLLDDRDPQFLSYPDQLRQRLGLHLRSHRSRH